VADRSTASEPYSSNGKQNDFSSSTVTISVCSFTWEFTFSLHLFYQKHNTSLTQQ